MKEFSPNLVRSCALLAICLFGIDPLVAEDPSSPISRDDSRLRALDAHIERDAVGRVAITISSDRLLESDIVMLARLPSLSSLTIVGKEFDCKWIAHLRAATGLEYLHLSGATVNAPTHLTEVQKLQGIKVLHLNHMRIDRISFQSLGAMAKLHKLDIGKSSWDESDLGVLEQCKSLHTLLLNDGRLSSIGIRKIAKFLNLNTLGLARTGLRDIDVTELRSLDRLEILDLRDTFITDAAIDGILTLKKLNTLIVRGTQVSAAKVEQLKQRPSLMVIADD